MAHDGCIIAFIFLGTSVFCSYELI